MIDYTDLTTGLQQLRLPPGAPVIAHASLSAFGRVEGGAPAVAAALVSLYDSLLMPAFTYKTMVVPEAGPPNNALDYGKEIDRNRQAEFYRPWMPVDRLIGAIPEALRCHPKARRSMHPILSFTGVNAAPYLDLQTLDDPLGPIRGLVEAQGWVLLLGVSHMVNTSIHYGERLAGRRQFIRWALTSERAVECPAFPGCSDGFDALAPALQPLTRQAQIGNAQVQAVPLLELIQIVLQSLQADPLALLCSRSYCPRCRAIEADAGH